MEAEQRLLIKNIIELKLQCNSQISVSELKKHILNEITVDFLLVSKITFHLFVKRNYDKFQEDGTCLGVRPGRGIKIDKDLCRQVCNTAENQVVSSCPSL